MKDKGSVWMDCYKELDVIMGLYKAEKISLQEFGRRISAIDKRLKAAAKEMQNTVQKEKKGGETWE